MEATEPGDRRTGTLLAEARAAAGIELVDIARETRVPLRHLKAIEADSHASLPALPYTIGFVKTFARAVGLDPETMATQFRAETSKVAHVPTVPSLEPLDERRVPSRGVVLASIAAIGLIIVGLSAWGAGAFDPAPSAVPTAAFTVSDAPVSAPIADVGMKAVPVSPTNTALPNTAPITDSTGAVVLTATEDVWVKVYNKASRTSAKVGILKSGESFSVPADPPGLLLWTGKAGALTVTVGGKVIPPLGGPVQTVRDISLSAADLLARAAPAPVAAPATPGV